MAEGIELVLLREVTNNLELSMITAILDDNSIPYIIKDMGSGGYMRIITGYSPFATKIMVEEDAYERAIELITPMFEPE